MPSKTTRVRDVICQQYISRQCREFSNECDVVSFKQYYVQYCMHWTLQYTHESNLQVRVSKKYFFQDETLRFCPCNLPVCCSVIVLIRV